MAVDILDQDEVDALLHGVDTGAVNTQAPPDKNEAQQYHFATQSKIVRGRMPTLEMINERFARQFRMALFNMLRRTPELSVLPITLQKFSEYVASLQMPSNLNLVRISPFAGVGLVTLEPQLLFAVVDSYFGGSGRHTKVEGRDFTATEIQIVQMLLHQVFSGLKDAWSPVMGIDMEFISSETNPTFVNISSPTEIVVVSRFHVEFEGNGGNVDVTMPYSMIDPIKELLMAGIQSGGTERDKHWGQSLRNKLEDTEVDLLTVLCRAQVSLRDLIELRPGAVIPCDFDGSATVTGDGITLFKGDLGHQRGRQVVKVTEMMGRKHNNALDALVRTS